MKTNNNRFSQIVLIILLGISLLFPAINVFFLYPAFTELLFEDTEEEAVRVASHLASIMITKNVEMKRGSFSGDFSKNVEALKQDLGLMKLKIFSRSGEIVYSTDPEDIGKINQKSYFHEIVAKGKVYTKVVKKETKSLEDQIVPLDVVETYVPVMKEGGFHGAFEIYYDITRRKEKLDKLAIHFSALLSVVSLSLLVAIVIFFFKSRVREYESRIDKDHEHQILQPIVFIIASLFSIEFFIMLFIGYVIPPMPEPVKGFMDGFLLSVLLTPVLYLFVFRPMIRQINSLEQSKNALNKAEREWNKTFNSISDFVSIRDSDFKVVKVNKALADFVGAAQDDIIGRHCYKGFRTTGEPWRDCPYTGIYDSKQIVSLEVIDPCLDVPLLVTVSPIYDDSGNYTGAIHIAKDISELKRAENELKESHERFITVLESMDSGIYVANLDNYVILYANKSIRDAFGEVTGKVCWRVLQQDQRGPCLFCRNKELFDREGNPAGLFVSEFKNTLNGKWYELHDRAVRWIDGSFVKLGILTDITNRKKNEEMMKKSNLELEEAQRASLNIMEDLDRQKQELDTSLKEKEVLLREIHHRVKNNMQVISSLLNLQTDYVKDEKTLEMFIDSHNRIKSMALIHEKLYQSNDLASIDFNDYLVNLTNDLFRAYGKSESTIQLEIIADSISIGIDTAIPCGLVINELLSNSIKYAFPEGRKGKIGISMTEEEREEYKLIVSDNGIGIPEEVDFRNTTSLGLQLVVDIIEEQLEGEIELDKTDGTTFHIQFKEMNYEKRV